MPDEKILLGFEIGTGEKVWMSLAHTVVTGMSQLSGKTTTLQAIIDRSKLRAIAFKTKRGEAGFNNYHEILPYFVERSDWSYVSGILEAYLKEKLKFERSWIMKAAKGTKSLKEVLTNIQRLKETAHGLSESVYSMLEQYLEEIIPQIDRFTFSKSLDLEDGINVMDLSEMSLEMRLLVIRSVMEQVINNMHNVIVVVPEAWEAIPQGRNTPVKLYAETFIRKGASIGNYLFIDSQDIAGIDKTPLRQCNNWIMGRQRETHEVERVREVIGKKVSEEEIKTLKIGHFIAAIGDDLKKVYVLPTSVPFEMGMRVAMELLTVDQVKDWIKNHSQQGDDDDEMYRQKFEELSRKHEELKASTDQKLEEYAQKLVGQASDEKVKAEAALQEANDILDFAAKGLEIKDQVIDEIRIELEDKTENLSYFEDFISRLRNLLGVGPPETEMIPPITEGYLRRHPLVSGDEQETSVPVRSRSRSTHPGTVPGGVRWIELFLPKLSGMEQKILVMMANKYPLELTKSEIALSTSYSVGGGSFVSAVSKLERWKLIMKIGDKYKLAQGPPG